MLFAGLIDTVKSRPDVPSVLDAGGRSIRVTRRHQMEIFSALLALLCGEFNGARRIIRTKASDAEL